MNFDHVRTFIFDLDNTLYHPRTGLMDEMHTRMSAYIEQVLNVDAQAAYDIRVRYWQQYGTTMAGLVAEHGIKPDDFMAYVHDIDLSRATPCAETRAYLQALPGRRVIFTNADAPHAERVLAHLGLADLFEDIYDVNWVGFQSKPALESYHQVLGALGEKAAACAMFEDTLQNLKPAHDLGMTTIWVTEEDADHPFVHHRVPDILTCLKGVVRYDNSSCAGNESGENENPQSRCNVA